LAPSRKCPTTSGGSRKPRASWTVESEARWLLWHISTSKLNALEPKEKKNVKLYALSEALWQWQTYSLNLSQLCLGITYLEKWTSVFHSFFLEFVKGSIIGRPFQPITQ
jgi:hypothetical protein